MNLKPGTKEYYAEYYKNNKEKHRKNMKKFREANPEKKEEYCKKWKSKNKDRVREKNNEYKRKQNQKRKGFIDDYKKSCFCLKCEESRFYMLDFHHKDSNLKDFNLGEATKYSLNKIKKEIEKCIMLCRNCHSEFHYLEKLNSISLDDYLKL